MSCALVASSFSSCTWEGGEWVTEGGGGIRERAWREGAGRGGRCDADAPKKLTALTAHLEPAQLALQPAVELQLLSDDPLESRRVPG